MPKQTGTPVVDNDQLAARLNTTMQPWAQGAHVRRIGPLTGGASSLTFLAELHDAPVERAVIKVAFPGVAATTNQDVLRQALLLTRLDRTAVPVPQVLFSDAGSPPLQPPLFAMAFVAGSSYEPHLSLSGRLPHPAHVRARALAATNALADLHALSPADLGYTDEPEVTVVDEIERWSRAYRTLPPEWCTGHADIATALIDSTPPSVPPRLTHGDYRLGNTLCDGSRLAAIIDWEIWARSDPRIDVGWFLLLADPAHPSAVRDAAGMPRPSELLNLYGERTNLDVTSTASFFRALALFKFGATTGLIAKHDLRNPPQTSTFRYQGDLTVPMALKSAALLVR